jgi:hypothetical protein
MLHVYRDTGSFLTSPSTDLPGEIIWMDLVNPTEEEKGLSKPVLEYAFPRGRP